ncbi:hypothetical protein [Streptosporangium sp. NPDC002524]|uniref:hypothetical protein n=1 Tax=Streptosporangium sp. NPDC002524 TaxID=3154537 RepID=UPI0033165E94
MSTGDYVSFTLANPLGTKDSEELGLEARTHAVGEQVTMLRRDAMRLVAVGYVKGADPNKIATVHTALTTVKAKTPAVPKA